MATWFDGVTVFVEVAWDDAPFTAVDSCTWTDETAYVRDNPVLSSRRGRSTELTDFAPGTMTVTFDNSTRRFDDSNTAGALYGKLLPMKQIRWRVVYGGTTAYLFTGLILGFPITYPGFTDSTVTVNCVDRTRLLEQAALPGSAYAVEVLADSPTYYWPLQESSFELGVSDSVGALDLPRGYELTGTYPHGLATDIGVPIGQPSALGGGGSEYHTGGSALGVTANGVAGAPTMMEMWAYPLVDESYPELRYRSTIANNTSFLSVKPYTTFAEIRYSDAASNKRDSTGSGVTIYYGTDHTATAYHLAVTISATTITIYVNGVSVGSDTLAAGTWGYGTAAKNMSIHIATTLGYSSSTSVSHLAVYTGSAPSPERIKIHALAGRFPYGHPHGERTGTRCDRVADAVGWPAADTDLSTGETFCGDWLPDSGSALAALRELEDAEQGLVFISGRGYLTFRDRQWQMTNTRSVNAQVVFDDDGTDVDYAAVSVDGNHIDYIRNQVTVTYPGGSVSVKDATSVAAYGPQSDSVNANPLPVGASFLARQLANFRLRVRKDPASRVPAIEINPRSDIASSFAVATLEIGDRVQVIRRPSGGTGTISKFCQVQGIEHSMSADDWTIRLYLAPAPKSYTEALYLIAGGSSSASYVGAGYMTFPGTDGNYLSVPDETALDIVGDLDARFEVAMDDWTPASTRYFGGKWTETGNQRSWRCGITTTGALVFSHSTDGTAGTVQTVTSTANISAYEVGSTFFLRFTIDVNNGAGGNDVKFWYYDGQAYVQIGATVTTGSTTSIHSGTSTCTFGGYGPGTSPFAGRAYRMTVRDSIGASTQVLDINARVNSIAASFTATTGQTVTVNGASVGLFPASGGNLIPY